MKAFLAAFLALTSACAACAGRSPIPELAPRDHDPSIAIIVNSSIVGHGCAVEGLGVLTAAHVVTDRETGQPVGFAWSQRTEMGIGFPSGRSPYVDLAQLDLQPPTYTSYPIGHSSVGGVVYWYEYDFRTRNNILRARLRYATILRVVAGHIMLSDQPVPGASGTCLFSADDGGVVGIINSYFGTQDRKFSGMAVMLVPKQPQEN